ncbi:hypothetical protein D3C71_960570 [compost metagenome]
MAEIFTFYSEKLKTSTNRGVAVFIGTQCFEPDDIDAIFSQWIKKNPREETVIVIGVKDWIVAAIRDGSDVIDGLDRLEKNSDLRLFGFDREGRITEISRKGEVLSEDMTGIFEDMIASYITKEIFGGDVIVPAPPGFWFEKLSDRYASHFIRTEAMFKCTLAIELLALSVLPVFQTWRTGLSPARQSELAVYIDSMSIWPLAQKMVDLAAISDSSNSLSCKIESFKSYDGLDKWSPQPIPSFVLISASTSGGLAQRVSEVLANSHFICTIIGLVAEVDGAPESDEQESSKKATKFRIIYSAPRKLTGPASFNDLRVDFVPGQKSIPPGDEAIQIMGERFANRHAKPRLVRLLANSLSEPVRRKLVELVKPSQMGGAVPIVIGKMKPDGKDRWPISFDLSALHSIFTAKVGSDPDRSLLSDWMDNFAPAGEVSIVYSSAHGQAALDVGPAAKKMADDVQSAISKLTDREPVVVSLETLASQYEKGEEGFKKRAFILVAPVVGNGFVFKQASATLRLIQSHGPRLFVCYAALPESEADLRHLISDLEMGPDSGSYKFLCRFTFPVGRLEHISDWHAESELIETVLSDGPNCAPEARSALQQRLDAINSGDGLNGRSVFLPSMTLQPMHLSSGFAMWPTTSKIEGDHLSGHVLLTIAAALEATRSSKAKATDSSLRAGIFQQAILDPLTFTRYNDSVIQAAILRAAYPAELDYRSTPSASDDIAKLICKWVDSAAHRIGYAVPEFVLAIGLKKLRLRQNDQQRILDKVCALDNWLGALGSAVSKKLNPDM